MKISSALPLAALLTISLPQGDVPSRERIETDLAVRVSWPDGAPRHRWWRVLPEVELRNRSDSTTHRVVRSGDGSDAGWREPFLHASVERQDESGAWVALPPQGSARCARYHPDWHPDVVDLAPGESIDLSWLDLPPTLFRDDRPHRVTVHYEYRRQPVRAAEGEPPPPEGLGRMGDRPAFRLASEPAELRFAPDDPSLAEIERSLRLRLEGIVTPARWSDLRASAVLENRSGELALAFVVPDAAEATMPWDGGWGIAAPWYRIEVERLRDDGAWIRVDLAKTMRSPREADWRRRIRDLEPRSSVELSPARAFAAPERALEGPCRIRIRARYAYQAHAVCEASGTMPRFPEGLGAMASVPPFDLASDWIEIDLLP